MRKRRRTTLMTISAALFAFAPKCPICFLAYFGIFGVATASVSGYRAWLPPITGFWLALTIAATLFWQYRNAAYLLPLIPALALMAACYGPFAAGRIAAPRSPRPG